VTSEKRIAQMKKGKHWNFFNFIQRYQTGGKIICEEFSDPYVDHRNRGDEKKRDG